MMQPLRVPLLAAVAALLFAAASPGASAAEVSKVPRSFAGTVPAPEFPPGLDWLNTRRPLTMAELRGKIVLLDFWTYGCINCFHIIPDLKKLEKEYPKELEIIGVHSAKYANEGVTENIRQVILRYGLAHPVVNDRDYAVWDAYGAEGWPTIVLVDPAGKVALKRAGEGVYEAFKPAIQSLVEEFDRKKLLDRSPLDTRPEREKAPDTVLSFPGKVIFDSGSGRAFIADSSHDRIVIADAASGGVQDIAGGGGSGLKDGPFAEARFSYPQGMALTPDGATLYVADTGNHAIRALDLRGRTVSTFAGTGEQATRYPPQPGPAASTPLSSPWDLALVGNRLFIAMAGSHQIWVADLASRYVKSFAGSGAEGTEDGPREEASLAQPSGLAFDGKDRLYFANSEGNSVRWVDTDPRAGEVHTLAGSTDNLFDFGSKDGTGTQARMQHPLGVAVSGGFLYVADTYNSRIRRVQIASGKTLTVAGKDRGWKDGADPLFAEPGGIANGPGGTLIVADTNNQSIRLLDPLRATARTLVLKGIEKFAFSGGESSGGVKTVSLSPVRLSPGKAVVRLNIRLPDGYQINPDAPFSMQWAADGTGLRLPADASRSITNPKLPLDIPVSTDQGGGTLSGTLSIVWCRTDEQGVCLLDRVRLDLPYTVAPGGLGVAPISYTVELAR
jgi:DNA-binding beta-propeller fold protein YncE